MAAALAQNRASSAWPLCRIPEIAALPKPSGNDFRPLRAPLSPKKRPLLIRKKARLFIVVGHPFAVFGCAGARSRNLLNHLLLFHAAEDALDLPILMNKGYFPRLLIVYSLMRFEIFHDRQFCRRELLVLDRDEESIFSLLEDRLL
jgi:hypothetical protein